MPKLKPVVLDGRTLEGGGQLLRNAVCLSALTRIPIKITDIRGNRTGGGGLKAQHLACVEWLAHASGARVSGARRGSTELDFQPSVEAVDLSPAFTTRQHADGRQVYTAQLEIGTAGSTTLALQAILPFILFSKKPLPLPVYLTLKGGTNVSASPSFEYITQVLFPTLRAQGLPLITATLKRRGFNSIGCIEVVVPPVDRFPIDACSYQPVMTSNDVNAVRDLRPPQRLHATVIGPDDLHDQIRKLLPEAIRRYFPGVLKESPHKADSQVTAAAIPGLTLAFDAVPRGLYILLTATAYPSSSSSSHPHVLATDLLSSPRLFSGTKQGGEGALAKALDTLVRGLAKEWSTGAWVDEHMRDQIVIYRSLAGGSSQVCVGTEADGTLREGSLHVQTAEWVAKKLLSAKFDEDGQCHGCGFVPV